MKFEAVKTTNGFEVKTKIEGTWYTVADCYHVPTLGDAEENAKRIAQLLNHSFKTKRKKKHDTT